MQPVVKASVSCVRFDSISAAEDILVRRVVQADVSDMHRLVTRLAQELGEHRRQCVVDEQLH